MAASCLDEITKEMEKDESRESHATDEDPAQGPTQCDQSAEADAVAQKCESKDVEMDKQQQDAVASEEKTSPVDSCDSTQNQSKDWVDRVISAGHSILWPQNMTPSVGPTLLTGVKLGEEDRLVDDRMEWERKLENANLDSHMQFLRNAQLTAANHPMEATAWENGYVPEAQGLPADQVESRIQGSLPPLAHMVSRPRQPIAAGEELLCRFDAGVRPYWLRDWQSGFGGYTKVCEYTVDEETWRRYSVAHVVRPMTNSTNACLCFTLMSKIPEHKPWKRPAGEKGPSRAIILDLQEKRDWKMPATVMMHINDVALTLDDSMQVQCLPVCRTDRPKWAYRKGD